MTIPYLRGSLLFGLAAEVYLRHAPVDHGRCACGQAPCHRRRHAITVIEAAGVDPETISATDAQRRPWHERPVGPGVGEGAPPASYPMRGRRALARTAGPVRPATGRSAVAPPPAGGTTGQWPAVPPAGMRVNEGRRW